MKNKPGSVVVADVCVCGVDVVSAIGVVELGAVCAVVVAVRVVVVEASVEAVVPALAVVVVPVAGAGVVVVGVVVDNVVAVPERVHRDVCVSMVGQTQV